MIWLLSAFKPNVLISIQAWLLLKHTGHTLGASLSTDIPKCLIGYHQYLRLLASHRLDPCKALNLGVLCSRQLHGNVGPCRCFHTHFVYGTICSRSELCNSMLFAHKLRKFSAKPLLYFLFRF